MKLSFPKSTRETKVEVPNNDQVRWARANKSKDRDHLPQWDPEEVYSNLKRSAKSKLSFLTFTSNISNLLPHPPSNFTFSTNFSIERDAQLLANRIALLKQEEMKTWKKIEETKKRASDVQRLKHKNEERAQKKMYLEMQE